MIYQNKQPLAISETLAKLKTKGYVLTYRREATCLYCFESEEWIKPGDFGVDESYYFEDITNPDEDRVLYALTLSNGSRGCLVDVCNVYTDNISYEMEQKLQWKYPLLLETSINNAV